MGALFKNSLAFHREILKQKQGSNKLFRDSICKANLVHQLKSPVTFAKKKKNWWNSFSYMWSIYFEKRFVIPSEFRNRDWKKISHISVAGFFQKIHWISNLGFIFA